MSEVNNISILYNTISKDYDLGSYDDFKSKMSDPNKRKLFYDQVNDEYDLGNFNEFEQRIVKKKDVSQQFPSQNQESSSGLSNKGAIGDIDEWIKLGEVYDTGHPESLEEANKEAGEKYAFDMEQKRKVSDEMVPIYKTKIADARESVQSMLTEYSDDFSKSIGGELSIKDKVKKNREKQDVLQALKLVDEIESKLDAYTSGGGKEALKYKIKHFEDIVSLGWSKVAETWNVKSIADKYNEGAPLTEAEQTVLALYGMKQDVDMNIETPMDYSIVGGLIDTVPYMVQFALTSGSTTAAQGGLNKAMGVSAQKTIANYAKRGASFLLANSVRPGVFSSTYEGTAERQIGKIDIDQDMNVTSVGEGETAPKAALKSYLVTGAEVITEGFMDDVVRVGKAGGSGINKIRKAAKIGNLPEEFGEEMVSAVLQSQIEGQNVKDVITPRMMFETAVVTSIINGAFTATEAMDTRKGKVSKNRNKLNALGNEMSADEKKKVDDIVDKIDPNNSKSVNEAVRKLEQIQDKGIKDEGWTESKVKNTIEYASRRITDNSYKQGLVSDAKTIEPELPKEQKATGIPKETKESVSAQKEVKTETTSDVEIKKETPSGTNVQEKIKSVPEEVQKEDSKDRQQEEKSAENLEEKKPLPPRPTFRGKKFTYGTFNPLDNQVENVYSVSEGNAKTHKFYMKPSDVEGYESDQLYQFTVAQGKVVGATKNGKMLSPTQIKAIEDQINIPKDEGKIEKPVETPSTKAGDEAKLEGVQPLRVRESEEVGKKPNITFNFTGERKFGTVIEKSKGIVKVKGTDGIMYSVKDKYPYSDISEDSKTISDYQKKIDEEYSSASPKRKHYAGIEAVEESGRAERVKLSPKKGSPKPIFQILEDVATKIEAPIQFRKTKRKGAGGEYNLKDVTISLRNAANLDTATHEVGHFIEDYNGFLDTNKENEAIQNELSNYWSHGSKPPAGHPDPLAYKMREGFAEWYRAYVFNPKSISKSSPVFQAFMKQIPKEHINLTNEFSDDVRVWGGMSELNRQGSNIEYRPVKKTFKDNIKKIFDPKKFTFNYLNERIYAQKGFMKAADIQGAKEILPEKDFVKLESLMHGIDATYNNVLDHGLVDSKYERIKDTNGETMNVSYLYKPAKGKSPESIKRYEATTSDFMSAQRTVDIVENSAPKKQLKKDLIDGIIPPDSILKKYDIGKSKILVGGKEMTVDDRLAELNSKKKKYFSREGRYDFTDVTITGSGGGVISDYESAKAALIEFEKIKGQEEYDIVIDMARRYREFADANMRMLRDSGRISKDAYNEIKEANSQYVSFNRLLQSEPGVDLSPFTSGKSGKIGIVSDVIKERKGSAQKIQNPYTSLLESTYTILREARRNNAMKSFTDMLIPTDKMSKAERAELSNIGRLASKGDPNTISIYRDGSLEYWQFDPDVFQSLKGLNELGNYVPELLTWYATVVRTTVTSSPVFAWKNLQRDFQERLIKGKGEMFSSISKDYGKLKSGTDKFTVFGGGQFGYQYVDKANYYDHMDKVISEMSGSKDYLLTNPKKLWEGYKNFLSKSETINRAAEYNSVFRKNKKAGMDDLNASIDAAYQARNLLDFTVTGAKIRSLNRIFPFTNARIQGFRRLVNSAKETPAAFAARFATYAILPQLANSLLIASSDDETKKRYLALPHHRRDMFYHIPLPDGRWYVVPKPFELGVLSSGIGRVFDVSLLDDDRAFDDKYGLFLMNQLSPIDPAVLIKGTANPITELRSNHDSFRDKYIISPEEKEKAIPLRYGTKYSSRIGQGVMKLSGDRIDPRNVDYMIQGLFSYYGTFALRLSDLGSDDPKYSFNIPEVLGVVKQQPIYSSKDVQWIMEFISKYDITNAYGGSNDKSYKKVVGKYNEMKSLIKAYYAEENKTKKKIAGDAVIEYSGELRKYLEDTGLADTIIQKAQK